MDDNTHHFGGDEVINSLCAAIEALEEFQGKHYDWRWVRKETEALLRQLECILDSFEKPDRGYENRGYENYRSGGVCQMKSIPELLHEYEDSVYQR